VNSNLVQLSGDSTWHDLEPMLSNVNRQYQMPSSSSESSWDRSFIDKSQPNTLFVLKLPHHPPVEDWKQDEGLQSLEKQMAEHQIEFQENLKALYAHYILEKTTDLSAYLTTHRALPSLLIEIAPKLKSYFGSDAIVKLELNP